MSDTPTIYVACLAAYNQSHLHGEWIDATQELDDIKYDIEAMLKASPAEGDAEEYAIHDYEGFQGISLSEYDCIENIQQTARFIDQYGELGAALLSGYTSDIEEATRILEEQYCGCYPSLSDYMEELTESSSQIPDHLSPYIDYHRMGEDAEMSGDLISFELGLNQVHIFWGR